MNFANKKSDQLGFTLIEMIVSLAIFSIVITMAIGALLVLIASNQRLQGEQSVMTNLSFALDSMTREIRTGYNYVCHSTAELDDTVNGLKIFDDSVSEHENLGESTKDCPLGRDGKRINGISFFEGGNSILGAATTDRRIMYYYDHGSSKIMRRVGNSDAQSVVSSGLKITDASFTVTGSATQKSTGNNVQPTVTIFIQAEEIGNPKVYRLQTTVTQRILDL